MKYHIEGLKIFISIFSIDFNEFLRICNLLIIIAYLLYHNFTNYILLIILVYLYYYCSMYHSLTYYIILVTLVNLHHYNSTYYCIRSWIYLPIRSSFRNEKSPPNSHESRGWNNFPMAGSLFWRWSTYLATRL